MTDDDPKAMFRHGHCDAFAVALTEKLDLPGALVALPYPDPEEPGETTYEYAHSVAVVSQDPPVVMDVDGAHRFSDVAERCVFDNAPYASGPPELFAVGGRDYAEAFSMDGPEPEAVDEAKRIVEAEPDLYRIPDEHRYPPEALESGDGRLRRIVDALLEAEDRPTWADFVARQEMGDCQFLAKVVEDLGLPGVERKFGSFRVDEEAGEDTDEPPYVTHHWIEIDGEVYEFAKGTLRDVHEWADPLSVSPDIDEADRYGGGGRKPAP